MFSQNINWGRGTHPVYANDTTPVESMIQPWVQDGDTS